MAIGSNKVHFKKKSLFFSHTLTYIKTVHTRKNTGLQVWWWPVKYRIICTIMIYCQSWNSIRSFHSSQTHKWKHTLFVNSTLQWCGRLRAVHYGQLPVRGDQPVYVSENRRSTRMFARSPRISKANKGDHPVSLMDTRRNITQKALFPNGNKKGIIPYL